MSNNISKSIIFLILTIILFVIQYFFSKIGWIIADIFDYSSIDKDSLFMRLSVHHIMQMLLALVVIFILHKTSDKTDFKLKPKYDKNGIKYTFIFCAVIFAYFLGAYIIGSFLGTIGIYDYELTATNVIGTLAFQLLLSGTSEEILFRSLPIVWYKTVIKSDSKFFNIGVVLAVSFLFAIAHYNAAMPLPPQLFQIIYAFVLGLAYGFVFLKSKSVVYPMIMHGMSNFISVGGCYIYMYFFM